MNREQNDWVSFLKELMEFVLSPSNHLISIGPKLDGNTLHNRVLSWEWTTIFFFELAHVFYRVCAIVIHGERGLMEAPGKLCLFYSPGEGWFRNLAQSFLHNISSYSPPRWTPVPPLVRMFLLTGKRFTRWSSRLLSIACIILIIRRNIRAGRGLFSLCSMKSLF